MTPLRKDPNPAYVTGDTVKTAIYVPLNPKLQQIRLLRLQPGQLGDAIDCRCNIVSFDDDFDDYEALSYVWGSRALMWWITLDGGYLAITENLRAALVNLRHPDRERILWVDAICINQADPDERSAQVSQMHSIYTRASRVVVFLGDTALTELIMDAFRFINQFGRENGFQDDLASIGPRHEKRKRKVADTTISTISELMARPWWTRVWTVQEFVLAQSSRIYYGRYYIDGAILFQCARHLQTHHPSCCALYYLETDLSKIVDQFRPIYVLQWAKAGFADLLQNIGLFRDRQATDARDKVYGMLALSTEELRDSITPNYALPVEKVFEDLFRNVVSRSKNLDVLSHLIFQERSSLTLPSYIPDWTITLDTASFSVWSTRFSTLRLYNACNNIPTTSFLNAGGYVARGVLVDVVHTMVTKSLDPRSFNQRYCNDVLDEMLHISGLLDAKSGLRKTGSRRKWEAFWLTINGGLQELIPDLDSTAQGNNPTAVGYQRLHSLPDFAEFEEWERWFRASFTDQIRMRFFRASDWEGMTRRIMNVAWERLFMATRNGFIGFIPRTARPGDVLAVLTGCRVPVILRPGPGFCTVVGDAYVHDIMDGEAMQDSGNLQDIILH